MCPSLLLFHLSLSSIIQSPTERGVNTHQPASRYFQRRVTRLITTNQTLKGITQHFGKCASLLPFQELNEKVNISLIFVR